MTRVKNRRSDAETIVYLQVGMPKWKCLSGNAQVGMPKWERALSGNGPEVGTGPKWEWA
jgi:hypothetical protein